MSSSIKEYVSGLWWLFVLQGIATIIFGIVALFLPGLTLVTLLYIFAIYVLVLGVLELVHGFSDIGKNSSWWFSLLVGVVMLGVSVYLLRNPQTALDIFIVIVGALVLARGVFDLFVAAFFVEKTENRLLWIIGGVLGVIAGIIIWRYPVTGGIAFVWVLGLYAILAGSISLSYAFNVRSVFNEAKDEFVEGVESVKRFAKK